MFQKIKQWYREFLEDWKATSRTIKRILTAGAVIAAASLAFAGHIFSAVVIGGVTFLFWRSGRGVDKLVGTV